MSYAGRILQIDLTSRRHSFVPLPQWAKESLIGGKGFGVKMLLESFKDKAFGPYDPEAPLMYVSGPLTGTMAPSMRGCVVCKSPLTGMFNDSYFGGHFAQEMKYAGYDAMVITGQAQEPSYILIDDESVEIRPAREMWGLDTYETYAWLRKNLGDDGFRISCIGPAGENLVRYAVVDCDPHRQAGRCGAGAVMGSKKLKAVIIRGTGGPRVSDPRGFIEAVREATKEIADSTSSLALANSSSLSLLDFSNTYGFFPTRNFSDGWYEKADPINVGGQSKLWVRHVGCAGCPIHCSKMVYLPNGQVCDNVEYETTGLLGGNLDIADPCDLAEFNELADRMGLDTISLGAVLGFAAEAFKEGLLKSDEWREGGIAFGNSGGLMALSKDIAHRCGIGDLLAEGLERVTGELGPKSRELGCFIQGLETPAWGPRGSAGMGLAYLSGDRGGCHQRAFPIGYETEGTWLDKPVEDGRSTQGKAEIVAWEQNLLAGLYSLVACEFGRSGISTGSYIKMLNAATGLSYDEKAFFETGERIWTLIRCFNLSQGWTQESKAKMPPRFRQPLPNGMMKGHVFDEQTEAFLLKEYNSVRGWSASGEPLPGTQARLKVNDLLGKTMLQ
jgi:aldehyde:ferredoxin oxidoreductase